MLLRSLKLNNLLSFGPEMEAVELKPLNVLIGPNGSGKSNFIEAIGLLQAAPKELVVPIREGGGVGEWIWKGAPGAKATVEAVLAYRLGPEAELNLRHSMAFVESRHRLELVDERLENERPAAGKPIPYMYFGYNNGIPMLNARDIQQNETKRALRREDIDSQKSILAQRKDPDQFPELAFVSDSYEGIRLYRDWTFGRYSAPRRPQPADLPVDHLLDDARNLGMILQKYRNDVATKQELLDGVRTVFEGITDFSVSIFGGSVQVILEEGGAGRAWTIPATRLSDGTVRWLALLAILLDPNPPPLVCIEEPELGLHPDLMNSLALLLKRASERMQIIITTHSDILVDAFSGTPDDVLVCNRQNGVTTMERLDREALAEWLQNYSLGELWTKGELGGTRW